MYSGAPYNGTVPKWLAHMNHDCVNCNTRCVGCFCLCSLVARCEGVKSSCLAARRRLRSSTWCSVVRSQVSVVVRRPSVLCLSVVVRRSFVRRADPVRAAGRNLIVRRNDSLSAQVRQGRFLFRRRARQPNSMGALTDVVHGVSVRTADGPDRLSRQRDQVPDRGDERGQRLPVTRLAATLSADAIVTHWFAVFTR